MGNPHDELDHELWRPVEDRLTAEVRLLHPVYGEFSMTIIAYAEGWDDMDDEGRANWAREEGMTHWRPAAKGPVTNRVWHRFEEKSPEHGQRVDVRGANGRQTTREWNSEWSVMETHWRPAAKGPGGEQ